MPVVSQSVLESVCLIVRSKKWHFFFHRPLVKCSAIIDIYVCIVIRLNSHLTAAVVDSTVPMHKD